MQTKVMTFLLPRALIRTQLWCVYVCARMHVCVRACVCASLCVSCTHTVWWRLLVLISSQSGICMDLISADAFW